MKTKAASNAPQLFEIRVTGHLSEYWAARFEGLSMQHEPEGETALSGMLDQSALHGVLVKIRDLGLNLISVKRVEVTESSYHGTREEGFQPNGDVKNE